MRNWTNSVLRRGMKGSPMSSEQKPITAKELLAKGWKLTQQSMALVGMSVPCYLYFQIDGRNQIRATRVAELDDLAEAIAALDEDIGRLVRGEPALVSQLRHRTATPGQGRADGTSKTCQPERMPRIDDRHRRRYSPTFRSRKRQQARRLKMSNGLRSERRLG